MTRQLAAKPGLSCADDRLSAIGKLELAEDVGDVVAHRLAAQVELPGDRVVGVALSDQVKHLTLPLG